MKPRYSVSFFIIVIATVSALTFAYYESYTKARLRLAYEELEQKEEQDHQTEAVDGKKITNPKPASGYYLKNDHGYVVVYLSDEKTLYEETSILVNQMEPQLQKELEQGKYVQSLEELYGFLENYSS